MPARLFSGIRDYYTNPMKYAVADAKPRVRYSEVRIDIHPFHAVFGLDELGEGHYSRVFAINSKWVLKIDCNNSDQSYAAFVDYARKNQDNPYLPRVRAVVDLGACTGYILERLTPVLNGRPVDQIRRLVRNDYYESFTGDPDPMLLKLIAEFGPRNLNDIGVRNFMMRGDQLVFTDPCCGFSGLGAGTEEWLKRFEYDSHVRTWKHHNDVERRRREFGELSRGGPVRMDDRLFRPLAEWPRPRDFGMLRLEPLRAEPFRMFRMDAAELIADAPLPKGEAFVEAKAKRNPSIQRPHGHIVEREHGRLMQRIRRRW